MKIDNVMTHVLYGEDLPFLRRKLFDVNMRLFRINRAYRELIRQCCDILAKTTTTKFEDYKDLHGVSGANLAIPFNIIGVVRNRGQVNQTCEIMINPKITRKYGDIIRCKSNCGSIRLEKLIVVERSSLIDLKWYDVLGFPNKKTAIGPEQGSFTIQHEVEHNLGILITDI